MGLAATASHQGEVPGVESFPDVQALLAARPDIDTISLSIPPVPRFEVAAAVLAAGRNLMLEKLPGATLAEVHILRDMARAQGVSIFASWHSRMAHAVAPASCLAGRQGHLYSAGSSGARTRRWHPGQDWIFAPGGMGVFDPGINALSILTEILPHPTRVLNAEFLDIPENRQAPIAARLDLAGGISADFDFRQAGPADLDMEFTTNAGSPWRCAWGEICWRFGGQIIAGRDDIGGEYPALYARMAERGAQREIGFWTCRRWCWRPMLTLGRRNGVAPFTF